MIPFFGGRLKRLRGPALSGAPIRVAIVGAGKFAERTWYPILSGMKGVNLVAAAARSGKRLEPIAKKFRVPARYTSVEEMLERERPEAVVAVLPPASVLGVGRLVLGHGVPLFLEKPPGLSSDETAELASLARARGVAGAVGFNRRQAAVVVAARRKMLEAGGIQSILTEFHKDKPAGGAGDDLVTDIIHSVDLLRALGGEVSEVASVSGAASAGAPASPGYHALVRFASGGTGVLAAFRTGGGRRERIELHGFGISAEIEPPERAVLRRAGEEKPVVLTGAEIAGSSDPNETYGYAEELRRFLSQVRGGADTAPAGALPQATLEDAVATMRLVEALREAARARTLAFVPRVVPAAVSAAGPQPAPGIARAALSGRPKVALLLSAEIRPLIFPADVQRELAAFAEILQIEAGPSRKEASKLMAEADGAVTSWKSPRLTADMAARAVRLRIIAHAAGSVKSFVDNAFFERGVAVTNAASAIAPSVGEMSLALMLAGLRSLTRYDREVRRGDYRKTAPGAPVDSRGLFGRRVGLVGFGRTARELVRLLQPFGCEILAYDPYSDPSRLAAIGVQRASLEDVLRTSDVVSLHAAYTADTHMILNAERLGWLKDGAVLVNTARGSLVDESALVRILRTGRITACLDVTVTEPLPSGAELATLPNVILTPHTAGPTFERLPELGRTAVADLRTYFEGGTPANLVTAAMLATMA